MQKTPARHPVAECGFANPDGQPIPPFSTPDYATCPTSPSPPSVAHSLYRGHRGDKSQSKPQPGQWGRLPQRAGGGFADLRVPAVRLSCRLIKLLPHDNSIFLSFDQLSIKRQKAIALEALATYLPTRLRIRYGRLRAWHCLTILS